MIDRRSNAYEIPLIEVKIDANRICRGCGEYSFAKAPLTLYINNNPNQKERRRVLDGTRDAELRLCRGCMHAYGATLEANGWEIQNSNKP